MTGATDHEARLSDITVRVLGDTLRLCTRTHTFRIPLEVSSILKLANHARLHQNTRNIRYAAKACVRCVNSLPVSTYTFTKYSHF